MKNKFILLSLVATALTSCRKTNILYTENAYNSSNFDENYYLDWDGIKDLKISNTVNGYYESFGCYSGLDGLRSEDVGNARWIDAEKENVFGYQNNLTSIDSSFNYGILSKLYDGRVRCDGYYQKSRVQLNKTGYATFFPKSLVECKYVAFACRGGTTSEIPLGLDSVNGLLMNFNLSFYIHILNQEEYEKIEFKFTTNIQTDNGGLTDLVSFYLPTTDYLTNAVAMSLEWECVDSRLDSFNLTDDYANKEKGHVALMLYEVFLGKSTWY